MNRKNIWTAILALGSAVISISFAFFGAGALVSTAPPRATVLFGALLFLYGMVTLILLGLAWFRRQPALAKVSKFGGLAFFAAVFVGSLDVGMISGLEWLMLMFVGSLLWLQFVAVRRVVNETNV
jgi:hypothetical protein